MGRGIVVDLQGEKSAFELTKIERDKLYGRKIRLVVDERERVCRPAYLTRDGSAVVPPGGVSHLYVDDHFEVVERSALAAVDAEGKPLALAKSTLGVEQPLRGPIAPERVLDFQVTSVYLLTPTELSPTLQQGLEQGHIYETSFNWFDDYNLETAFLLKNEAGLFALIGNPIKIEFLGRELTAPAVVTEADEPDEDELDFNML